VQHNFEQSHASGNESWDHTRGAMEGTSFLCLPPWLNWITANTGYHHVHHLSARIPSYCLAECHDEYAGLFSGVTRIRLGQVPAALKYIVWDTANQRLVSVAELQRRGACHQSAVSRMEACCRHPAHSRLWWQLVMPACRDGCGSALASPAFSGPRSRANGFCSAPSPRRHRSGWPRASAPRMGLSARGWPPAHYKRRSLCAATKPLAVPGRGWWGSEAGK